MTLFEELATLRSRAEGTPDWDGGSTTGSLQNVSTLLDQLPAGSIGGLAGGRLRFRDTTTNQPRDVPIVSAWKTEDDVTSLRIHVTVAEAVELRDSDDVVVIWPGGE